jgi:hypothetical protein
MEGETDGPVKILHTRAKLERDGARGSELENR